MTSGGELEAKETVYGRARGVVIELCAEDAEEKGGVDQATGRDEEKKEGRRADSL